MNRPTDLLEPTVPDLLELDSDFLRLDFPFDLRGISLLNFRNCRRQLLQIFLQKHNFQKWTFPTGNYCKQQQEQIVLERSASLILDPGRDN